VSASVHSAPGGTGVGGGVVVVVVVVVGVSVGSPGAAVGSAVGSAVGISVALNEPMLFIYPGPLWEPICKTLLRSDRIKAGVCTATKSCEL